MAGLYVYVRAVMLSGLVAAAAVLGGSCTCSDRVGGQEPQGYGEPACLWLITPWDNRADRSKQVIIDHENNRSGTACLCLTEDEYDSLGERLSRVGWPEDGTLLKEFNELAYDECKRLVEVIGGLVDDECREYYEGGRWLKHTYFARSPWENSKPPGFTCIEP